MPTSSGLSEQQVHKWCTDIYAGKQNVHIRKIFSFYMTCIQNKRMLASFCVGQWSSTHLKCGETWSQSQHSVDVLQMSECLDSNTSHIYVYGLHVCVYELHVSGFTCVHAHTCENWMLMFSVFPDCIPPCILKCLQLVCLIGAVDFAWLHLH